MIKKYLCPFKKCCGISRWFFWMMLPFWRIGKFYHFVKGYLEPGWLFWVSLANMALGASINGAFALLLRSVFTFMVSQNSSTHSGIWISILVLTLFFIKGLAEFAGHFMMSRLGQRLINGLRQRLMSRLLFYPYDFFAHYSSGSIDTLFLRDSTLMGQILVESFAGFITSALSVVVLWGVMVFQNPKMSLMVLILLPLLSGISGLLGKKIQKKSHHLKEAWETLSLFLHHISRNILWIKASQSQKFEIQNFDHLQQRTAQAQNGIDSYKSLVHPILEWLCGVSILLVVLIGHWQIQQQEQNFGSILAFVSALLMSYQPMKNLSKHYARMQESFVPMRQLLRLFQKPLADQDSHPSSTTWISKKTNRYRQDQENLRHQPLYFENVDFSYPTRKKPILSSFNCQFPPGALSAIVGPSGEGKSTLFYLLLKLYQPNGGNIFLGPQSLNSFSYEQWRRHITFIGQNPLIVNGSIMDNIAYNQPKASKQSIYRAARMAEAHDFIQQLPQGYQTILRYDEPRLSGGQKQRICIARAFLKNSPLILLDEVTSALDSATEQDVLNALQRLAKNRRILMISHRSSLLNQAQHIVFLHQGKCLWQGPASQWPEKNLPGLENFFQTPPESNF